MMVDDDDVDVINKNDGEDISNDDDMMMIKIIISVM